MPARWPAHALKGLLGCLLGLLGTAAALSAAQAPAPGGAATAHPAAPVQLALNHDQVLDYIHRVLDWYHHVFQVAQLSGAVDDPVTRDRLQGQAQTLLQLAFELGKAAAPLVSSGSGTGQPDTSILGGLQQASHTLAEREVALRAQLTATDNQLHSVHGEPLRALQAHRETLAASLELVHEAQSNVQQMLDFAHRAASGTEAQGTLAGQLAELERALPQGAAGPPAAPAGVTPTVPPIAAPPMAPAVPAPAAAFRVESAGILGLVQESLALRGTQNEMLGLRQQTDDLLAELKRLRAALGSQAHEIMEASIAATQQTNAAATQAQREAIEAGTVRFKQITSVVVPLSEQVLVLTNARGTLQEWSEGVDRRFISVMRYLALRLGLLLASVLAVLVASDLWRRATMRYVRDPRRRRPLLVLRRLAVGLALVLVVAFGLASEVGSLATFMGFLTAGIALSLQNVILSVVAYFFLIGRYGVQVGDRITLAGATGRVIDISLLRLYLLELNGSDLHSTGRLVVLSNATLFQPTPLYKQIPGADYVWHTVTLTVAPGADIGAASRRLSEAAAAVFREYRTAIERQHALMQQHVVYFETRLPGPQVAVDVAADGVRCLVRYPVPPEDAVAIDQQMLNALRAAVERDERLQLLETGAVKLSLEG